MIYCFYGSQGTGTVSTFRARIFVGQSDAELNRSEFSLVGAGTIYNLPEFINSQWVRRYDPTITLPRKSIRTYNVRTLQDVPISFLGN